jgi:hypothetical protein
MQAESGNESLQLGAIDQLDSVYSDEDHGTLSRWRSYMTGSVGRFTAAITIGVLANLTPTGSALAEEPTCYGDYCSGQYASDTNCDEDARTLHEVKVTGLIGRVVPNTGGLGVEEIEVELGSLELRASDRCGTRWARLSTVRESGIMSVSVLKDDGYTQKRNISGHVGKTPPGNFYTKMIYSPQDRTRALVDGYDLIDLSTDWK